MDVVCSIFFFLFKIGKVSLILMKGVSQEQAHYLLGNTCQLFTGMGARLSQPIKADLTEAMGLRAI